MTNRETPKFTGITTFVDPQGRYSFRYPTDWNVFELADGRDGVLVSPYKDSPQTFFSVWISPLEYPATAEDFDELRAGVDEGLEQLEDCQVLSSFNDHYGDLIKFERLITFREGDKTRKRRFWIMYVNKWLFVVTLQGESIEDYQYWVAMANHSFHSFTLPPELWFLTDRNLNEHIVSS